MTGFLMSRFCRMFRKGEVLNRFFYSDFDPAILEERRACRERSRRDHGEPSSSGPRDPKEEPVEEMTRDLENWRYNFYLHPTGVVHSLVCG